MSKKHLDFKRMLDDTDFSDPSSGMLPISTG